MITCVLLPSLEAVNLSKRTTEMIQRLLKADLNPTIKMDLGVSVSKCDQ